MKKKVIDFNRLPKQEYMKPVMEVIEADMEQQILAGSVTSVTTTGLGDENIDKGETPGDSWGDAMSRRSVWDE